MKIESFGRLYQPINKIEIKSTRNPVDLYKMMKMYSQERKEIFPWIHAVLNCIDTMLCNCKMRIVKDDCGNLLASYTYKFIKNEFGQKSMYLDALVRNRKRQESKNVINYIYKDMKKIATDKQAKELTLYSKANEKALRRKYEQLGFKNDERNSIEKAYFMRVPTIDFLY